MSNRAPPFGIQNCGRSQLDPSSMDYVNRVLNRYSRATRPPQQNQTSDPPPSPAPIYKTRSPRQGNTDTHRTHKRKRRRQKMTAFNGPWSPDLDTVKKSVQSMPDQYKSSFASASKTTLDKVCDPNVLHVYESDSDIDNLLHLTSVIAKLCNLGTRKTPGANASDGSLVILAEEKTDRNNFARICQLVEYLTGADGKRHLDGAVVAFSSIIVVRGWNNALRTDKSRHEADKAVKRMNTVLERVFSMGNFSTKKIVWHHGAVLGFLLHWINTTTSTLRNAMGAITITGSLDLTTSVAPSGPGRANTLADLKCLENYTSKLDVPVVFLDAPSLGLTHQHLNTYMYYYAYYIRTFLPMRLLRPHLHAAQDALVVFAFRILGASASKYGAKVVSKVKSQLAPSLAKSWALDCITETSYAKKPCRDAAKDSDIHNMVHLADAPFLRFNQHLTPHLPAFARLAVGPAAKGSVHAYTALPISIDFAKTRMQPAYPARFYIAVPSPACDSAEKITNHVQGTMMAVLERVRQEHAQMAPLAPAEKEVWDEVRKVVVYALRKAGEGVPGKVKERVGYVSERMEKGIWGLMLGVQRGVSGGGVSEAARANQQAETAYGGLQQMGGFAGAQHTGVAAPPNSPGTGPSMPMSMGMGIAAAQGMYPPAAPPPPQVGAGFSAQHMGYGQRGDLAYAQSQGVGVSGRGVGYPAAQSMGGPWM